MIAPVGNKTVSSRKFVLGGKSFAAISAVEGLKLRPASEERFEQSVCLSQTERRAETIRAFAGSLKRG
jgi:hypothetical protein